MFEINGDFLIDFILSSPASSFVSSLVSTSAATLVLVSAIIAVLAIVVVGVEIRIETLFLLILEETGIWVSLIAEFGSCCCYCIADICIRRFARLERFSVIEVFLFVIAAYIAVTLWRKAVWSISSTTSACVRLEYFCQLHACL